MDEFHLFVNPVALGKAMTNFKELGDKHRFVLEASTAFLCGIVLLKYRKATGYQLAVEAPQAARA